MSRFPGTSLTSAVGASLDQSQMNYETISAPGRTVKREREMDASSSSSRMELTETRDIELDFDAAGGALKLESLIDRYPFIKHYTSNQRLDIFWYIKWYRWSPFSKIQINVELTPSQMCKCVWRLPSDADSRGAAHRRYWEKSREKLLREGWIGYGVEIFRNEDKITVYQEAWVAFDLAQEDNAEFVRVGEEIRPCEDMLLLDGDDMTDVQSDTKGDQENVINRLQNRNENMVRLTQTNVNVTLPKDDKFLHPVGQDILQSNTFCGYHHHARPYRRRCILPVQLVKNGEIIGVDFNICP